MVPVGTMLHPGALPGAVLAGWLADPSAPGERLLRLADGRGLPLPVARWAGPPTDCDQALLARARGPVLDVGCGPGRLTAALHERGTEVLGLELLDELPVLARAAGAPLHLGDVFDAVPAAGTWRTALLADGNVGIGGDPARLLTRVRELLSPDGEVLCELQPEAVPLRARVRLETGTAASAWFDWGLLGTADLSAVAASARLDVVDRWAGGGREFAALRPA